MEMKCPLDPSMPNAWEPGDLNKMFERLSSEPYLSKYDVKVLSSPATGGPWVLTMENLVSEEEANRLIELGGELGYARSTDVGVVQADGTLTKEVSEGGPNTFCKMLVPQKLQNI